MKREYVDYKVTCSRFYFWDDMIPYESIRENIKESLFESVYMQVEGQVEEGLYEIELCATQLLLNYEFNIVTF